MRSVAIAALLGAASGCSDPLKELELVEAPRVLAARVEVEGDPGRAAPSPGERARVRWLVAAPEPELPLAWAFAACVPNPNNLGLTSCATAPFAAIEQPEPALGEPRLDFEVPAELDPNASPRLAILGVVCPHASLTGTGEHARCASEGGTQVSLEFELNRENDVNLNPSFAAQPLTLDGEPWPADLGGLSACAGGGAREVRAGSGRHEIGIAVAEDARDPLPKEQDFDPEREELQISHFSTDGGLERPFSSIASSAVDSRVSLDWVAPKNAPEGGLLARFWFVVRDLRGGSDFTTRALCVTP